MSTIKVDNIRIASESVSRPVTGVAAAWVNFNGVGTVAIRDSMNVGSITDSGTGLYKTNFSSIMAAADYAVSGCIPYASWSVSVPADFYGAAETSSKMQSSIIEPFQTYYDANSVYTIAHGELA